MSKGSWKRPMKVSHEEYSANYDRIFGKQCCERDHDHDGNCDRHPDQDIKEGRAINLTLTVGDEDDGTPS